MFKLCLKLFMIVLICLLIYIIINKCYFEHISSSLPSNTTKKIFLNLMPGGLKTYVLSHSILSGCTNLNNYSNNNIGLIGGSGGCWTIEMGLKYDNDLFKKGEFKLINSSRTMLDNLNNIVTKFKPDYDNRSGSLENIESLAGKPETILLSKLNVINTAYTNYKWEDLVQVIFSNKPFKNDSIIKFDNQNVYYCATWVQNKIHNTNTNPHVYNPSNQKWFHYSNRTPLGIYSSKAQKILRKDLSVDIRGGYLPLIFKRNENNCNQIKIYDSRHFQSDSSYDINDIVSGSSCAAAFWNCLPNNGWISNFIPMKDAGITKMIIQTNELYNELNKFINLYDPGNDQKISGTLQILNEDNFEFIADAAYSDKYMIFNIINSHELPYDELEFICIENSQSGAKDLKYDFCSEIDSKNPETDLKLLYKYYLENAGDASIRFIKNCQVHQCLKETKNLNNSFLQIYKINGIIDGSVVEHNQNKKITIYFFSCNNTTDFPFNIPLTYDDCRKMTQGFEDFQNIINNLKSSDLNLSLTFINDNLVPL